ncbi:MAG: four helix bundle protein [bacterium]
MEANEALSKKDFMMRIKICRKEAKESRYWLRLVDTGSDAELEHERRNTVTNSVCEKSSKCQRDRTPHTDGSGEWSLCGQGPGSCSERG